jgi:hypothetical protein
MSEEDERDTERLTNAMSLNNLADRLKAQMMTGRPISLNTENNAPAPVKPADKPPKQ